MKFFKSVRRYLAIRYQDLNEEFNRSTWKHTHPKRVMLKSRQEDLKRAIRLRLMNQYGYHIDYMGRWYPRPKPRVRYRLKRTYHWNGKQLIGVYQCIIAAVAMLFFLSSPTEAKTYASVSGTWTNLYYADGRWLDPNRAAWMRPEVRKAYSPFEIKHPAIPYLFRMPVDTRYVGYKAYMQMARKQEDQIVLSEGSSPIAKDWRKFWTWFAAIGTLALVLLFALVYGQWRAVK